MLPVEILPVQETIVLRARGSELLILPHHVKKLKGYEKARDFSQYFRAEALVNRPARKLFEAWLRKDQTLWSRLYQTIHKEMVLSEGDGTDAVEGSEEAPKAAKKKADDEAPKAEKKKEHKAEKAEKADKAEKKEHKAEKAEKADKAEKKDKKAAKADAKEPKAAAKSKEKEKEKEKPKKADKADKGDKKAKAPAKKKG